MKLLKTLLLFLFLPALSFAQQTVVGSVTDMTGRPVVYAEIRLPGTDSVLAYTDVLGHFRLESTDGGIVVSLYSPDHLERKFPLSAAEKNRIQLQSRPWTNGRGSGSDRFSFHEEASGAVVTYDAAVMTTAAPPPTAMRESVVVGGRPDRKSAKTTRTAPASYADPATAYEMEAGSPPPASYADDVYSTDPAPLPPGVGELANRPDAGQLTAGEVNDFSKWELWNDVRDEDLAEHRKTWGLYPDHRYAVQLIHPGGSAAVNVPVKLVTDRGRTLWASRTDNLGRAELWRGMLQLDRVAQSRLSIVVDLPGQSMKLKTAHSVTEGLNVGEIPLPCQRFTAVDVAFVVDATGSMGDEIAYLSSELTDVMKRAGDSLRGQDIRIASVFYRDQGDEYVTRVSDFSDVVAETVDFVQGQSASGGGDTPEAVDAALTATLDELDWREKAATRLVFLVLDAPPHSDSASVRRMQSLAARAAVEGIRIVPVVCSGMDKSGEYLLRSLALATNGTYTFLTDHSGIGNPHLEPSTDAYEVEKLNDLLVRVIHQFGKTADCQSTPIADFPSRVPLENTIGDWTLFPNPTFGPTTVNLPGAKGELFLLDTNGKVLRRYPVNTKNMEVNLSDLPSATYYFRYRHEAESSVRKVIVNRA